MRRQRHLPRGPPGSTVPGLRRPAEGHAQVVRHALEAGQGGRVDLKSLRALPGQFRVAGFDLIIDDGLRGGAR